MTTSQHSDEFPGDSDAGYDSLAEMEFQSNVSGVATSALKEGEEYQVQERHSHVQELEELLSESESEGEKDQQGGEGGEEEKEEDVEQKTSDEHGFANASMVESGDELNDESDAFDDSDLEVIRVTSQAQTRPGSGYNREQSVIDLDSEEDIENLESEEDEKEEGPSEADQKQRDKSEEEKPGSEGRNGASDSEGGELDVDSDGDLDGLDGLGELGDLDNLDGDLKNNLKNNLDDNSDEELLDEDSDSPISTEAKKRAPSKESSGLTENLTKSKQDLNDGLLDSLSEDEDETNKDYSSAIIEAVPDSSIIEDENDSSVTDEMKFAEDFENDRVLPILVEYLGKRYMIYRQEQPECDLPDVVPLYWGWESLGTVKEFLRCVMISDTDRISSSNRKIKSLRIPELHLEIHEEHEDADAYHVDEIVRFYKMLIHNSKQPKPKYLHMIITFTVSFREQYKLIQKVAEAGKSLDELRAESLAAEAAVDREIDEPDPKRRRLYSFGDDL
ncbi:hypothetical protein JCM33374_g4564 [Metschnikowia sp. JCM 33374]|nr:hypothetical protein JCM33374_g4564 [Metschnikowia sp. JCM 33374]